MIVDAHMHIWQQVHGRVGRTTSVVPIRDGVVKIGDRAVLNMPPYMHECRALAEHVLAEFDAAGVEAGVVVQEYLDGEQNGYLLDTVARHPGRFFIHGLVDFFDPDAALEAADRLFAQGFRGLKIPGMHLEGAVALDDSRLMPIYRQMEDAGFVLAVDLAEGAGQVPMMRKILDRHPQLNVAIGHFGMVNRGGWPDQLELCRYPNVFIETGGIVWLYRDEGYPFPSALDAILHAAEAVGPEKIMWGSDWPRTMVDFTYRQSLDFVRLSPRLTPGLKAAILGNNAARLYGLAPPTATRRPIDLITEG